METPKSASGGSDFLEQALPRRVKWTPSKKGVLDFLQEAAKAQSLLENRSYEVVVYGATGFTGSLVCLHFARHTKAGNFRWALGGRRVEALQALKQEIEECGYPNPPTGIIVGDANNEDALTELVKQTKLVLSTSGPYSQFGLGLVKACAEQGTHYVDITGESIPFVRDSIAKYDTIARRSGAQIVHCAGYDSVPSDILARMASETLSTRGERCVNCVCACDGWSSRGKASGGTIASVLGILSHLIAHPVDLLASIDQDALSRDMLDTKERNRRTWWSCLQSCWWLFGFGYDDLLRTWHAPFVMAFCNHKVVRRTQRLRAELGPQSISTQPPAYKEVLTLLPGSNWGLLGLAVVAIYTMLTSFGTMLIVLLPKKILAKIVPSPGWGPSAKERNNGKWRFVVAALGDEGSVVRGEVVALDQDPGYASTSVIVAEVARAMLEEDTGLSGVLTPAVAAPGLADRLKKFGINFSVNLSNPEDEYDSPSPFTILLSTFALCILIFLRLPEVLALVRRVGFETVLTRFFFISITIIIFAIGWSRKRSSSSEDMPVSSSPRHKKKTFMYYVTGWRLPVFTLVLVFGVTRLLFDSSIFLWQVPTGISLKGKRFAITGANSGLGFELTRRLASLDAEVVMLCRSAARCQSAAESMNYPKVTVGPLLDISDLRSVEHAGKELRRKYGSFDALVLNAGFYPNPGDSIGERTAQGLEIAWGAMHVGHVLLETLIPSKRIVVVGSEAHHFGRFEDFVLSENIHSLQQDNCTKHNTSTRLPGFNCAYLRAKRANIMHAQALAAKYGNSRTVVAVTPGFVRTQIIPKNIPMIAQFYKIWMRSLVPGGLTLLRATIDDASVVNGKVVDCMTQVRDYHDICFIDGGCDLEQALTLHRFALRLANTLRAAPPPSKMLPKTEISIDTSVKLQILMIFLAIIILSLFAKYYKKVDKGETDSTMVQPPRLVEALNTLVHTKAFGPLFDALFWAWTLFVCGLVSPFALLYGLYRWLIVLACICFSGSTIKGNKNLAVVITGCDSGFGYWLSLALSRLGFTVFAGLLSEHNSEWHTTIGDELIGDGAALPHFVHLDVTKQQHVNECVLQVKNWIAQNPEERRLLAVVNNAGRGGAGHAELLSDEALKADMEVNYVGVHRVCRAFLPLLRKSPGSRILIVASMAGKCPGFAMSAYAASKHAVVALAASFRFEQVHVPVCVLCPSFHRTPIFQSGITSFEKTWRSASSELQAAYGGEEAFQTQKEALAHLMHFMGWDPQRVVDSLIENVISRTPPPHEIPIGLDAKYPLQILRRLGPTGEKLLQKLYFSFLNNDESSLTYI